MVKKSFPCFAWFLTCIAASMEAESTSCISLPCELYAQTIIHEGTPPLLSYVQGIPNFVTDVDVGL